MDCLDILRKWYEEDITETKRILRTIEIGTRYKGIFKKYVTDLPINHDAENNIRCAQDIFKIYLTYVWFYNGNAASDNLHLLRFLLGETIEEVAKRAGVHAWVVQRYEEQIWNIDLLNCREFARVVVKGYQLDPRFMFISGFVFHLFAGNLPGAPDKQELRLFENPFLNSKAFKKGILKWRYIWGLPKLARGELKYPYGYFDHLKK